MTDIHVYPTNDQHHLATGGVLHSPTFHLQPAPVSSGRYSSPSFRPLPGNFEDQEADDGGAEIPDIPLRRLAMAKGEGDLAALTPLAQILAGNREPLVGHRPINPNDIQSRLDAP